MKTEPTEAGDMLYKFAEMREWNKNKLIGWSEAADFADWFANQSSPKIKQLEWVEVWEGYEDACNKFDWKETRSVDRWDRSAIIGSVEIVDCVINHPSVWAEKTERIVLNESWPSGRPACAGKKGDTYNWVLANPVLFDKPIIGVRGKLGFWDYDLPEEYETILKL